MACSLPSWKVGERGWKGARERGGPQIRTPGLLAEYLIVRACRHARLAADIADTRCRIPVSRFSWRDANV